MSVITAVSDGTRVCMACDSQASNNGSKFMMSLPKFVKRGPFLIGSCDGVIQQLVRYALKGPWESQTGEDVVFWVEHMLMPWLRDNLRERRAHEVKDGIEQMVSSLLIASRSRFAFVDAVGFSVAPVEHYAAIGSGYDDARGAMWLAIQTEHAAADEIALAGVRAAIAHNIHCGGPAHHAWTDP